MNTIVRDGIEVKVNELTYSKPEPCYRLIASAIGARINCMSHIPPNNQWRVKWEDLLISIQESCLPTGSGFDSGTRIDIEASNSEKIVLRTSFHHMNDAGVYDGWSEHVITVTPSLQFGFNIRVSGQNRNDIKEFIAEMFHGHLSEPIVYDSNMQARQECYARTRSNMLPVQE